MRFLIDEKMTVTEGFWAEDQRSDIKFYTLQLGFH